MYEIIHNWNNLGKSLKNEKYLKDFKRNISKMFNEDISECVRQNCYSCKYNPNIKAIMNR